MEGIGLDERRLAAWREARHAAAVRRRLVENARELLRQREAAPDLRCGFCGMWHPRAEMSGRLRDGVVVFCCDGCNHAHVLGLNSRLELGSVPVGWSR